MNFSTEQISPGKWGIYSGSQLLATVSSEAICKTVMANLANDRRDLPTEDESAIYSISAELKPPLQGATRSKGQHSSPASAGEPTESKATESKATESKATESKATEEKATEDRTIEDEAIEKMLSSLSKKELEDVLIKAQQASVKGAQHTRSARARANNGRSTPKSSARKVKEPTASS